MVSTPRDAGGTPAWARGPALRHESASRFASTPPPQPVYGQVNTPADPPGMRPRPNRSPGTSPVTSAVRERPSATVPPHPHPARSQDPLSAGP